METPVVYRRKLSGEEALKRFILVLNESVKLFPKPGMPFTIQIGKSKVDAELKLVESWSQGARKPAIEYHIDLSKYTALFRPHYGQTVTLKKLKDDLFVLE